MKLDKYTYHARLLPALITSFPALLVIFIVLPPLWKLGGSLSAVGISAAIVFLMAQCGRDAGKKKEPALFQAIGGKPSTRLLRHADVTLPPATKKRYHDFLRTHVPGFVLPTPQQESSDTASADRVYDSAADWLRSKTRDAKLHELLFAENVSYGFRRNLWGMKVVGILMCLLGIAVIAGIFLQMPSVSLPAPMALSAIMVLVVLVFFWISVVKPVWVALPAEAYARMLLEFCDKKEPST